MNISIIIPTFDKLSLTKKCLDSLFANTPKELIDVIVVDNNSTDGTEEYLNRFKGKIQSIINKKNLGFAKACNQGAKKSKGEILVFLNNDTEVQKGWLEPLIEELKNEDVGAVGSKLLFPNGRIQHAGIVISKKLIPHHIYYDKNSDFPPANIKREFQAVTAACMAIKKDVFFEVSGFDENYINGLEDVDICLKVRERGYKVMYCPESVVMHHEGKSQGRNDKILHNENIFLKKWKGKLNPDEEKHYSEDGLGSLYKFKNVLKNKIKRELKNFTNDKS